MKFLLLPWTRSGWLFCLAAFAACWLCSSTVLAQKVTLDNTSFEIIREEERSSGEFPFYINREDCFNADASPPTEISLRAALSDYQDDWSVEVWLGNPGNDCTQQDMRVPTTGRCARLYSDRARGNFLRTITLDVQDVVHGAINASGESVEGKGTAEDCETDIETNVVFYVMLIAPGNVLQGQAAQWTTTVVDLSAPPPPDSITVASGDDKLFVNWEIATSSEDDETQGFVLWCVPSGTMQTIDPTGFGGQGGAPSSEPTTPPPEECNQNVLRENALPPGDEYKCGDARGRSARSGQLNADNGTEYAVAVSARDQVANEGRLSPVACGTPEEVTTFFEQYRADGGRAGGGYCAWAPPGSSSWALLAIGLLGGAWLLRSRRRA